MLPMPPYPPSAGHRSRFSGRLLSRSLLLLGASGFAAAWLMLALHTGRQHSWMAVLGALDVAIVLRLGHWRPGAGRVVLAVSATAAIIVLANWLIIAAHLGSMLGLLPWDSALRLGFHHAWTLAGLANGAGDVAWMAVALAVAAVSSR